MKGFIFCLLQFAALHTNAQISIAPEFGTISAKLMLKNADRNIASSLKYGVALGCGVYYDLSNSVFLGTGLFYQMTGTKLSDSGRNIKYSINTLKLPVNIELKISDKANKRITFFGAGIYVSDNFSGRLSGNGARAVRIGSTGTDDITPTDWGAGINFGHITRTNFLACLYGQLGLSNLRPEGNSDNFIRSAAGGITIGYFVAGKKPQKISQSIPSTH
jgi:hypothetical protein